MNAPLNQPAVLRSRLPDRYATHDVTNQAAPATGFNAFEDDAVLRSVVARDAPWARVRCAALGRLAGDAEIQEHARLANAHPPVLRTHDAHGNRIDWVETHPSWQALMRLAWGHQVHSLAWNGPGPQPHFARAVLSYLWGQIEQGSCSPIGTSYASFAGFEREPALAVWADRVRGGRYSTSRSEVGDREAVVVGYAITEKQAGSDMSQIQTRARYSHSADYHGGRAHWYELTGHKWYCAVPQADGFFTLGRVDDAITCFFLPRTLPDGGDNRFFLQRLKDTIGVRSCAVAEVEFSGTQAIRVGEEGQGLREILSHLRLCQLDSAVGSAGLMRQALTLALRHTATRRAFGAALVEKPMMNNVLADLAVEVEASTLMVLRIARAMDHRDFNEHERKLARLGTLVAKYFNGLRASAVVFEALQCHGGNGYVDDGPMARLFRDAPANSLHDGAANLVCLEVRRLLMRDPGSLQALFDEVAPLAGQDRHFDRLAQVTDDLIRRCRGDEFYARPMTEAVARMLQAAELLRHGTPDVTSIFFRTRTPAAIGAWGVQFGTLAGASAAPIESAQAAAVLRRAVVA